MSGINDLDAAIAQGVARLDELDKLRLKVRARIESLRASRELPTAQAGRGEY